MLATSSVDLVFEFGASGLAMFSEKNVDRFQQRHEVSIVFNTIIG